MRIQTSPQFLLPLILACAAPSHARLGDTVDQAEARYGLPRKEPARPAALLESAREVFYHFQDWVIRCAYVRAVDGQEYIVRQEYRKAATPEAMKKGVTLTIRDYELEAILEAESNRLKWKKPAAIEVGAEKAASKANPKGGEPIARKVFERPDGARASVSSGSDSIQFDLPYAIKYEAALKALHEQAVKSRLPEF